MLSVANHCGFRHTLDAMESRCARLLKRGAFVSHYEGFGVQREEIEAACARLADVAGEYEAMEGKTRAPAMADAPAGAGGRLKPVGLSFVPDY